MAASTMLNFRTSVEFAKALDQRAKEAGLSRSDFIREALEEKVSALPVNGRPHWARHAQVGARVEREARSPVVDAVNCPHPDENVKRLPTGVRLCNLCGTKLR